MHSDVSWGAKGANKVSKDLGVFKTNKGENAVDAAVQTAETDISAACEDAMHALSTKPSKKKKKWMQQLHREIITSTSGQCVRCLTLIHVMTCCFRSSGVLMGAFKCGCLVGSNTIGDDLCVTHYSGVLVTVILQVLIYISSAYLRTLTRYAALETRAQRRVARTKQPTDSLLSSSALSCSPLHHILCSLRS